ncbi:MAG: extracellular solute-binding protein [Clostridiales bacterium]|nr:extracellular solute-binding protein [Clostridiales bacterium]
MMRKRLTAALLLLTTVMLASCSFITWRGPEPAETDAPVTEADTDRPVETADAGTTAAVTEAEDRPSVRPVETVDYRPIAEACLDALPDWDFGGIAITLVTADNTPFAPELTGDIIPNSRIERNGMVEKKYNTKILVKTADIDTIWQDLRLAVEADDYYADLLGIGQTEIGRFQAARLLMNMLSLPFTDYTAPYFHQAAMKQLTSEYVQYGAVGAYNETLDYLYGLFFNRTLAEKLELDPYGAVYGDEWDYDAFRRMTKKANGNVDGRIVAGHGSSLGIDTYTDLLFAGSGIDLVQCGWGKKPVLGYGAVSAGDSAADRVTAALRRLLYTDKTVWSDSRGAYTADGAMEAFCEGGMLFYTDRLYFTSWIADMRDNWGLLPFPTADGSYHTYCDLSMPILCAPADSTNSEYTGLFLQAANAASYGWLTDVYYENLQINVVRDSDTLNMLDRICGRTNSATVYSYASFFGSRYPYIADATYLAIRSAVRDNFTASSYYTLHSSVSLTPNR